MDDQHRERRGAVRRALPDLTLSGARSRPAAEPGAPLEELRARRLRAPLLLLVWVLLGIEAAGGLVIFVARVAFGTTPLEALHVWCGVALTAGYAVYQFRHWWRVAPFRRQLHYAIGLLAAIFMAATNLTGLVLAAAWWKVRIVAGSAAAVPYPPVLSAAHNIGSMLVLTFVGAHLGAVLVRDRRLSQALSRGRR
jgi:hypothetical protein